MKTHFLRAEWNNLVMANYIVPPEMLLPYVPYKTELDFFEGHTYVSLVGLMFLNTKVFGFSIPNHANFEEVNLRFYIRYNQQGNWKTGVVFLKEIVPRKAVSFIANNLFGENYVTMNMDHLHQDHGDNYETAYQWSFRNKTNHISAVTGKRSSKITPGSCESFFADHYWGYVKYSEHKTYEYNVEHPVWETLKVLSYSVDCDFQSVYGEEFAFLQNETPKSVLMTKGSEIKLHHKRTLD
jgi:uncharacterized protein